MTPYQLMRDARIIELDMLDVCGMVFEDGPLPDMRPTLRVFSDRVGRLADDLDKLAPLEEATRRDAARWAALFGTEGVRFKVSSNNNKENPKITFTFVYETPVTRKLLASGIDFQDVVDRALVALGVKI